MCAPVLAVLVINTRCRIIVTVEVNDWNEKEGFCVVYLRGLQMIEFCLKGLGLHRTEKFRHVVIIKQDVMTCCHPLVNNQESHKPKRTARALGGRSNRFISLSLSHSLLYFVFTHSHTPYTEK